MALRYTVWEDTGETSYMFCGEINAPNRMGGMTGWKPFWVKPDAMPVLSMMIEPADAPACREWDKVDDTDYGPLLSGS